MKTFATILLLAIAFHSGLAQSPEPKQVTGVSLTLPSEKVDAQPVAIPKALSLQTVALSYHDTSLARLLWRIPSNYGDFISLNVTQHFTLPTSEGILDSIAVFLPELPLGEIRFDVYADTLLRRNGSDTRLFHFPNYFVQPLTPIDTARLKSGDRNENGYTVVRFNGKKVPKEFHIAIWPTTTGGISSLYAIYSDTKPGGEATITPGNTRTTVFIRLPNGLEGPILMQGIPEINTQFYGPMLYMIAYASVDISTSVSVEVNSEVNGLRPVYPNPAPLGSTVSIPFSLEDRGDATIEIVDVLGRVVARFPAENLRGGIRTYALETKTLRAGMYRILLRSSAGVHSRSFVLR